MGKVFDEEIISLKADFMKLGALVGEAVTNAGQAFVDHDIQKAEAVVTNDHEINHLQIHIEKRSFEMIALYQPVTGDLREVVGILKAVTDLERAGMAQEMLPVQRFQLKACSELPLLKKSLLRWR